MTKKDSWEEVMEITCHRFVEQRLGCKLTKRQFNAYCRAMEKCNRQEEIKSAIGLLEGYGYMCIQPTEE